MVKNFADLGGCYPPQPTTFSEICRILPPPGGNPLYKPCKNVPSQRVWFLGLFWSENGYTHYPFWSGIGNGFRRNYGSVWTYFLSFQFQINKKNRNMRIRNAFDEMFACALIQVITAWHNFYLKAKSKWHFLVWNRVRIWKTSCTPPPRIPTSTPPGILHIMRNPPPPKKKKNC